jgi:hypothetical protein
MLVVTFLKMWTIQSFGWGGCGDFYFIFCFEGKWESKKEECVQKSVNSTLNVDCPTIFVVEGERGHGFYFSFFVIFYYL